MTLLKSDGFFYTARGIFVLKSKRIDGLVKCDSHKKFCNHKIIDSAGVKPICVSSPQSLALGLLKWDLTQGGTTRFMERDGKEGKNCNCDAKCP